VLFLRRGREEGVFDNFFSAETPPCHFASAAKENPGCLLTGTIILFIQNLPLKLFAVLTDVQTNHLVFF
jgi:hypothetical protein